jgi:lysophospholipase L1-like esterase
VVPELPSEAATVLLGSNDAVGFFEPENQPVSVGDYAAALYAIVIDLLSDGVEYVVLMTAPRNYASQNPDVDLRLAAYREEVLQICSSDPMDGVLCGPDLYELLQPEHFASADVHPNAAGHLLIAEELYAVVPEPQRDVLLAAAILQLALLRALRGDKGISAVQPRYRHRHQAR